MTTHTPHQRLAVAALGIAGYGFWLGICLRQLMLIGTVLRAALALACFMIVSEMDYQDEQLINTYHQQAQQ